MKKININIKTNEKMNIKRFLTIVGIISILNINNLFAITNQEIIDNNNKTQKELFDKYFNGTFKAKNNIEAIRKLQSDVLINLTNKNNATGESELTRLTGNKKTEFRKMYIGYIDYLNSETTFSKAILESFASDMDDAGNYMYSSTYNLLEAFDLNINTLLEAEKDSKTLSQNIDTILDYYYYTGDKISKEEYFKMSNNDLKKIVQSEFEALNKEIDVLGTSKDLQKQYKNVKSKLEKLEKMYNIYDLNFDKYVDLSRIDTNSKESIKKLNKYECIANLRFFKQAIKVTENDK